MAVAVLVEGEVPGAVYGIMEGLVGQPVEYAEATLGIGQRWVIIDSDNDLWMDTGDGEEARAAVREGDRLYEEVVYRVKAWRPVLDDSTPS